MVQMTEYQKDLLEALKDSNEAAAYLNTALEEADKEAFLLALRNIAEANGGMKAVAEKTHLVQFVAWCRSASECDAGTGDSLNTLSDV